MSENWKKIFFYQPKFDKKSKISHAQLPTVMTFKNFFRVFFATRDKNNFSNIYCADFKIVKDKVLLIKEYQKSILTKGNIGNFDEHGVYPSSIIKYKKNFFLYYIGWTKGYTSPLFYASIGLAKSKNCLNFKKYSKSPIFQRGDRDCCLVTSPFIVKNKKKFIMLYTSGYKWEKSREKITSFYDIRSAVSKDGINWDRENKPIINLSKYETNITRAVFLKNNQKKIYYCSMEKKDKKYQINYALLKGKKYYKNKSKIFLETDNPKNTTVAYPYLFEFKEKTLMVYNGEDFGKKGFYISKAI